MKTHYELLALKVKVDPDLVYFTAAEKSDFWKEPARLQKLALETLSKYATAGE